MAQLMNIQNSNNCKFYVCILYTKGFFKALLSRQLASFHEEIVFRNLLGSK